MRSVDLSDPSARESFEREVVSAVARAVQQALLRSKKLGYRIVDCQNGEPVWIEPSDIAVAEQSSD